MIKIGLTGGIGSGKSTVASIFKQLGISIYFSDARAKFLMASDAKVIAQIEDSFGSESFVNGQLNKMYISKKVFQIWRYISNFNLPGKSRKNVEHHYDIGGERGEKLYDIFLDRKHRLYSCAYWKNNTNSLEDAQQNKIDHIIKKLDIKKGMKILEVGCGWGGMAFEIAKQKGCEVTGISLSKNQISYCKKKV